MRQGDIPFNQQIMAAEKIRDLRKVGGKPKVELDSVKEAKQFDRRRGFDILYEAMAHWNNMDRFRKERRRNKRYYFGDQWKDFIKNDEGEIVMEEDYIREQGNIPLKNNLIRRFGRNVVGVYESQDKTPTCTARDPEEQAYGETMSTLLQYNMDLNQMNEVYARSFEEFLISGLIAHRKWYGWNPELNKYDCWTTVVPLEKFFIDTYSRDIRGWDCTIVGQIHDVDWNALIGRFAHGPKDVARLADIYSSAHGRNKSYVNAYFAEFGYSRNYSTDFLLTEDPSRCRVIEVWRKESKPRYRCHDRNRGTMFKIDEKDLQSMVLEVNSGRIATGLSLGMAEDNIPTITYEWFMDEYWYCYYLSPFGDILEEGETEYKHKSHPFVFKAYPYIDGEIHSMVSDLIDQQRYINRLIMMYDFIMRASAKGVLLFPEEALPEGMSLEDVADEWHRFNGVIAINSSKLRNGVMPQQIANNATNIGIAELLNIELKFFEDIGINGALQGKSSTAGTSGTLYAQQAQNAATSLLDVLNSYSTFVVACATKDVNNMQQFYDSKMTVRVAGRKSAMYDPATMGDVEVDLSVDENFASPAYREKADQFLLSLFQSGQVPLETILENGNFPYKDRLLQSLRSQQQAAEQGQMPQPLPQDLMQQVQGSADMGAVNKAYGMLTKPQA